MRCEPEQRVCGAQRNGQPQAGGESPELSQAIRPCVSFSIARSGCSSGLDLVLQTMDDRTESAVFLVETQRMRCIVKCT